MKRKMKKFLYILIAAMLISYVLLVACSAMAEEASADAVSMPNEFLTWDVLGSYAGSVLAVMLITQFTKGLPYIKKVPTQIWSYALAVVILLAAHIFNGSLSASNAALSLVNGVLVSLSANGGYSLITRVKGAAEGQ